MARKDLLKSLMEAPETKSAAPPPPPEPSRVDAARPRYSQGAIGAVSRSIQELKSRAIVEIDPGDIDPGGMRDRLSEDETDQEALIESIREHGQQVPVLLRPSRDRYARYEVVFGRRRVAALKRLGEPVKAMIRDLDDRELVIAQGQENTARRNLTFIEKANFARQMKAAGYDRKTICDALHVDKTVVSRMLNIIDAVPLELVEIIGAAPSAGRDRWMELSRMIGKTPLPEVLDLARGDNSDARFAAVFDGLGRKARPKRRTKRPAAREYTDRSGRVFAQVSTSDQAVTIKLDRKTAAAFATWLGDNLDDIHRDWETRSGD